MERASARVLGAVILLGIVVAGPITLIKLVLGAVQGTAKLAVIGVSLLTMGESVREAVGKDLLKDIEIARARLDRREHLIRKVFRIRNPIEELFGVNN